MTDQGQLFGQFGRPKVLKGKYRRRTPDNRYQTDPQFRAQQLAKKKARWRADPDFREKKRLYHISRRAENAAWQAAKRHGIPVQTLKALRQITHCNLCGEELHRGDRDDWNDFHIDHDHNTGRLRGVLCRRCNQLIVAAFDAMEALGITVEQVMAYRQGGDSA